MPTRITARDVFWHDGYTDQRGPPSGCVKPHRRPRGPLSHAPRILPWLNLSTHSRTRTEPCPPVAAGSSVRLPRPPLPVLISPMFIGGPGDLVEGHTGFGRHRVCILMPYLSPLCNGRRKSNRHPRQVGRACMVDHRAGSWHGEGWVAERSCSFRSLGAMVTLCSCSFSGHTFHPSGPAPHDKAI
jgi:hypothetical protein